MSVQRLNSHVSIIDVKPHGIERFIASYILHGRKIAIIECGPAASSENLLNGLRELRVDFEKVEYVMVTHAHIDHWGGAGALLKNLPNAKLMVHPRGLAHLADPQKLWEQSKKVLGELADIFGKPQPIPLERLIPAHDGLKVDLGDMEVQVLETLGHSPHHVSYFERNSGSLFPGETAGMYIESLNAIVPATPPVIILDKLLDSIERLVALKPEKIYYTHYGPADNAVEKLGAYAQQLRTWSETINECLRNNGDLAAIIGRLRERDPHFNKAYDFVVSHPIIGRALNSIIQGFIVN